MHFVSESATPTGGRSSERRRRTLRTITSQARKLARERGFDGFTMDELAERVGVSRRTLFNYVPGKVDAVLGLAEHPDPCEHPTFIGGGPTGHLLTDLMHLVVEILEVDSTSVDEIAALRDLLRTDPRLVAALHERFEQTNADFLALVELREGTPFEPQKARLLQMLVVGMLDLALDGVLADPSTTMAEQFARAFSTAADLFSGAPDR